MRVPPALDEQLQAIALCTDRSERIQMLIEFSDLYSPVPAEVALPPFDKRHKVPGCESEAYVWARDNGSGWAFEFAIQNPQGLSAMAFAAILKSGLHGATSEQIQAVPEDIVYEVFGHELSMGKTMGLMNMLRMCKALTRPTSST